MERYFKLNPSNVPDDDRIHAGSVNGSGTLCLASTSHPEAAVLLENATGSVELYATDARIQRVAWDEALPDFG